MSNSPVASRLGWVAAGTIFAQLFTLAKLGVMARVLSVDQLGVYALLMAYAEGSVRINGLGIPAAIVHFRDLSNRELNSLLYLGTATSALTFSLALGVVGFRESGEILLLFATVGLGAVVRAPGEHVEALLQAEHRHSTITKISLLSGSIGDLVALALLMSTAELWPIVVSYLLSGTLYAAGMLTQRDWRASRSTWEPRRLREMGPVLSFAGYQFIAGLSNLVLHRVDRFILLFAFGLPVLGEYELAKQLVLRPYRLLGAVVSRVYFPIYAELQADRQRLSEIYITVLRRIVSLTAPAYLLLAVYADEVTTFVLGGNLALAGSMVRILCFLGFAFSIINPIGSFLLGLGKARAELLFQCAAAVWLGVLLWFSTINYDFEGSLWIYSVIGGSGLMLLDFGWRRQFAPVSAARQASGMVRGAAWAVVLCSVALISTTVTGHVLNLPARIGGLADLACLAVIYGTYAMVQLRPLSGATLAATSGRTQDSPPLTNS